MVDSRLALFDGQGSFQIEFDLAHGSNSEGTELAADVVAEIDGNAREREPPTGAEVPRVLAWIAPGGERHDSATVKTAVAGRWTVVLSVVEDTNTRASILSHAVEATQ